LHAKSNGDSCAFMAVVKSSIGILLATTMACAMACAASPARPNDVVETTVPSPESEPPDALPTSESSVRRKASSVVQCSVAPLKLMVRAVPPATSNPMRIVELAADGTVSFAIVSDRDARLDDRGCLTIGSEVVADASSADAIWTAHGRFVTDGDRIVIEGGRSMRIHDDGSVEIIARDGTPEPASPLFFEGYHAEAACSARVLLVTFMASMPSMAASDGNPPRVPAPRGSPCPHPPREPAI
jgi:hypothetical protein